MRAVQQLAVLMGKTHIRELYGMRKSAFSAHLAKKADETEIRPYLAMHRVSTLTDLGGSNAEGRLELDFLDNRLYRIGNYYKVSSPQEVRQLVSALGAPRSTEETGADTTYWAFYTDQGILRLRASSEAAQGASWWLCNPAKYDRYTVRDDAATRASAFLEQADMAQKANNVAAAEVSLRAALEILPSYPGAKLGLCQVLLDQGLPNQASDYCSSAATSGSTGTRRRAKALLDKMAAL
jgi:hypothetical protein